VDAYRTRIRLQVGLRQRVRVAGATELRVEQRERHIERMPAAAIGVDRCGQPAPFCRVDVAFQITREMLQYVGMAAWRRRSLSAVCPTRTR